MFKSHTCWGLTNLPVGEQEATGHTWQTEEVPNMIIAIQVQVLKQMQPNVILMHTHLNYDLLPPAHRRGGGNRLLSRIYFYFILFGTQKHLKIEIH
jgi:hypothetical protein